LPIANLAFSRDTKLNSTGTVILDLLSTILNASEYAAADILVSLNESISPLILFLYKSLVFNVG